MREEQKKELKTSGGGDEIKFKRLRPDSPNEVLRLSETAHLSYNPLRQGMFKLGLFAGDNFSDETALVLDNKFYVLNGDFREEYINAFKTEGIEGCCKLYAERAEKFGSTWTSHSDPVKFLKGMIERIITKEEETNIGDKTNGNNKHNNR
jgi:hypothetical protein